MFPRLILQNSIEREGGLKFCPAMKVLILIIIGLLVAGCEKDKQSSANLTTEGQDDLKSNISVRITGQPDNWGKTTSEKAEFHAASDVSDSNRCLTKKWYEIASKE